MAEFVWPVRVYYEDTDSGGVVYYANYLKFMERARSEWLRSLGIEQDVLRDREKIIFAVRAVSVDFWRPARFNELLQVSVNMTDCGGASITFEQQVRRDDTVLCGGTVRVACLDSGAMKPRRIPKFLLEEFVA